MVGDEGDGDGFGWGLLWRAGHENEGLDGGGAGVGCSSAEEDVGQPAGPASEAGSEKEGVEEIARTGVVEGADGIGADDFLSDEHRGLGCLVHPDVAWLAILARLL